MRQQANRRIAGFLLIILLAWQVLAFAHYTEHLTETPQHRCQVCLNLHDMEHLLPAAATAAKLPLAISLLTAGYTDSDFTQPTRIATARDPPEHT